MENRNYLHRLLFTIKKLRACGYATFEELSVYIQREFELRDGAKKISIRTFQRDMATIRELFNIDIKCNRSNQYYIAEDDQTGFNNRILEAFDTFNALNISDQISNFIHFEKRKPQGTENLYELLHAIRNKLQIRFTYQKYWEDEITLRRAEPYALKEFKNRWYILANDLKDGKIKSFALDRLSALEITKKSFPFPNDFDVNSYFKNCFGIMGPNAAKPS